MRRLEEFDATAGFDCGDEPLNNYLRRHAWINQQKSSIGVTHVAVDEAAPRTGRKRCSSTYARFAPLCNACRPGKPSDLHPAGLA
jgi:hypothetical protein